MRSGGAVPLNHRLRRRVAHLGAEPTTAGLGQGPAVGEHRLSLTAGLRVGSVVLWLASCLSGCLICFKWLAGWLCGKLVVCLVVWLVGCAAGWLQPLGQCV